MKRSLTLKREALAELSAGDLAAVAGGAPDYSGHGITCPATECVSREITCAHCLTSPLGC